MNELSLFSGSGGGLLGTSLLGWTPKGYVEIDEYCQQVIAQRIKDGLLPVAPIFSDINEFLFTGAARQYRGFIDVVTGGFPCFVASTMVLTEHGYRPIEDVSVGDNVLTHLQNSVCFPL